METEDVISGGENGGEVVRKGAGPVENDVTDHEVQSVRLQPIRARKEGIHRFKGSKGWGVGCLKVLGIRGLPREGCFDILLGYSFYESSSFNQT